MNLTHSVASKLHERIKNCFPIHSSFESRVEPMILASSFVDQTHCYVCRVFGRLNAKWRREIINVMFLLVANSRSCEQKALEGNRRGDKVPVLVFHKYHRIVCQEAGFKITRTTMVTNTQRIRQRDYDSQAPGKRQHLSKAKRRNHMCGYFYFHERI